MKKLGYRILIFGFSIFAANVQALSVSGGSFFGSGDGELQTAIPITPGSLSYFDSNFGVLNSVTFSFSGNLLGDIFIDNRSQQELSVGVMVLYDLIAQSNDTNLNGLLSSALLEFSTSTPIFNIPAGNSISFPLQLAVDSLAITWSDPNQLSFFQLAGGGTFDVTPTALNFNNINLPGLAIRTRGRIGVDASILYDYSENSTQLPEPNMLSLILTGFLLLIARAHFKI